MAGFARLCGLSPAPDTALSWQRQVNVEKISRRSDGDVASAGMTFQAVLCYHLLQASVGVVAPRAPPQRP